MTLDFVKIYSLFLAVNLVFIVLVLRAVWLIKNNTSPTKIIQMPIGLKKIFDQKRQQKREQMKAALS